MSGELVERIQHHDRQAMGELYQLYVGQLASVCYRYVPADSDAKDVLQNSFVNIFTSIQHFDYKNEASFLAWMKKIVVNEALRFLKVQNKLQFIDLTESMEQQIANEEPNPEGITADELHEIVSELPDGYRTVVNLFVFEGYSHKQIAEMLNIKEATSASQFYHAKRLLAKRIQEQLYSHKRMKNAMRM